MKICFVVDRYPPRPHSSIGSFVQKMARGLCAKGHQVNVVELAESHKEWDDSGVRVTSLRRTNFPYVGNLITRLRLRNWLHSQFICGAIELIEAPEDAVAVVCEADENARGSLLALQYPFRF